MRPWFSKARAVAQEIVDNTKFLSKLKLTEFWEGSIAARELAAAKFLKDKASMILSAEHVARLPGYDQFMADVREMSAKARIPTPDVYVVAGNGGQDLNGCPAMLTRDKLMVPQLAFFGYDAKTLRAIIGHELGHVKNGDMNIAPTIIPRHTHHEEYAADAFSARITRDPDSMISVLKGMSSDTRNMRSNPRHPNPIARIERLELLKAEQGKSFVDRIESDTRTAGHDQK